MGFSEVQERARKRRIPLAVTFELTYKCNLNCRHCYIIREKRKELSTAEVRRILRGLAKEGTLFVVFTGGEILARKDFFEIASYAESLGFAWKAISNGTLVDEKIAMRFAELNPLLLGISLNGFKPETHDLTTGVKGSWKKTMHAIELLKEGKVPLFVQTLALKDNFHELDSLNNYFKRKNIDYGMGPRLLPKRDGSMKPLEFALSDEQLLMYFIKGTPAKLTKSMAKKTKKAGSWRRQTLVMCGAGLSGCSINPYGGVFPCIQTARFKIGNLRRKSFSEIWHKSPALKKFRELTEVVKEECNKCEYRWLCTRCFGEETTASKDFQKPYPEACRAAKACAAIVEMPKEKYLRLKGSSKIHIEEKRS